MPNERPDQTTKAEVDDRSQAINTSTQDLSSSIWEGMRTPAKQLDAQPQRLSLADNNSAANSADAPLSIRTGVNRGTESLPAVEFFDSAAPAAAQAKPSDSANNQSAPANDIQVKGATSDMKWETYSASYVGGDIDWRSGSNQGTPSPSGVK